MKKIVFVVLGLIFVGITYSAFFTPDSHDDVANDQISIIKEVLLSIDQFEETENSANTVTQINQLTKQFKETVVRKDKLAIGSTDAELMSEIQMLSGELLNKSLALEVSEKTNASEVSTAFEAFISQ